MKKGFLKNYWLPILIAGVGGFLVYNSRKRKTPATTTPEPDETDVRTPSEFPLKKGSKGAKVVELQKALLAYNSKILPKYGADGDYGTETETAVKSVLGKATVDSQEEIAAILNKKKTADAEEEKKRVNSQRVELAKKLLSQQSLIKYAPSKWNLVAGNDTNIGVSDFDRATGRTFNRKAFTYKSGMKILNGAAVMANDKLNGSVTPDGFLLLNSTNGKQYSISPFSVYWKQG